MTKPSYPAALSAFDRGDYLEALTLLHGLLDAPDMAMLALLGKTLEKLEMRVEAGDAFEQAARQGGDAAPAMMRQAAILFFAAGDTDRAQLAAMKVLTQFPDDAEIAFILATMFLQQRETGLLPMLIDALAGSDDLRHLTLAATILTQNDGHPAELEVFTKLASLQPDDAFTQFKLMSVARDACNYATIETVEARIAALFAKQGLSVLEGESSYSNLLHCADERLNRQATNNGESRAQRLPSSISVRKRLADHVWKDKLRIGYLSSDFSDSHATMRLFQSVLEAHDPHRFDITLYCHTPDWLIAQDTGGRARWQRIVSVAEETDHQAAERMRRDGIDILVDLKGHTEGARSRILNLLVAPVQVAWLGFPGSTVDIDLDYVIGDAIVLPDGAKPHYHEKFCRLPDSYQPNDPIYRARPDASTRASLGLPENRIVLAAFNAQRKMTSAVIDCWAEVMRQTETAVLWIMIEGDVARRHVLDAFTARGIEAGRILFAAKEPYHRHIARLQAADIALDTFPYNGHTTTSDQLWAGLPVLTMKGSNFASRVSESLLCALGLPDLVAADRQGYVDDAITLATHPDRIAALKARIAVNRTSAPLFDSTRFCRHLETAYMMMAARARLQMPPDHLTVPAT